MNSVPAAGPDLDPESQASYDEVFAGRTNVERTTNLGTTILVVPDGNAEQARTDFDNLNLENVQTYERPNGQTRVGTFPDGNRAVVRASDDGRPAIEMQTLDENGRQVRGTKTEIRYGSPD